MRIFLLLNIVWELFQALVPFRAGREEKLRVRWNPAAVCKNPLRARGSDRVASGVNASTDS